MASTDYPWGYGMPLPGAVWPSFAERWLGGEYPSRVEPQALSGWRCPGCRRCFSPEVLQCRFCEPGEQSDAGEP